MPWQPGGGGLLSAPGSPMMPWGLGGSLTQQRFTGMGRGQRRPGPMPTPRTCPSPGLNLSPPPRPQREPQLYGRGLDRPGAWPLPHCLWHRWQRSRFGRGRPQCTPPYQSACPPLLAPLSRLLPLFPTKRWRLWAVWELGLLGPALARRPLPRQACLSRALSPGFP